MKKLNQKEWIAVSVAVFVVGFFFIFGPFVISFITGNGKNVAVSSFGAGSQISVKDTVAGSGKSAQIGDKLTVNYVGKFANGAVFDSSFSRNESFQFVLGSGQVIKGIDEGLVGMRVGGTRIITIPPEKGYGSRDYGPIPGNSTLIFEIQLLNAVAPVRTN